MMLKRLYWCFAILFSPVDGYEAPQNHSAMLKMADLCRFLGIFLCPPRCTMDADVKIESQIPFCKKFHLNQIVE